jgi:PAB-dependent poly(A)-specific ribonuclease subunit 3
MHFDPFTAAAAAAAAGAMSGHALPPPPQFNPYADDHHQNVALGGAYYPAHHHAQFTGEGQPLQYHLYYPTGTRRPDLLPHQRLAYDFFIPEKLREELHRKAEASRQVLSE